MAGIWLATAGNASALIGEETIYYHNDALGSPIIATDQGGSPLWREAYSPYGSRILHESREKSCDAGSCVPIESIWDEKHWYTGKLEETRTGIQYFGARWYEPELGRFLSVDPLQFRDDNLFSFNRYAYANGNPYKYVDPDGRDSISITGTIHVPGSLLHLLGVSEVPVSGFSGGIAVSFPGPWSPDAGFDFGLVGGANIPAVDVGLGKASVDIGYNKGSFADLSGDSVEVSATVGRYNAGINWDADSGELTGVKAGRGVGLGGLSKTLQNSIDRLKNGQVRSALKSIINNNATMTYQKNGAIGIRKSVDINGSPQTKRKKN
jgi:RHS repeat-associated protein